MKAELEEKLYKEFPQFFADHDKSPQVTAMCWGCQCEDGWYDLIRETCLELTKVDIPKGFVFNTVKEKFGRLLIYTDNESKEILDILDKATEKSKSVCEWCGSKEDVTQHKKGWIHYLCQKCQDDHDQILRDKWVDK